ncbi:DUF4870 domain-containing protein [Paenibacillus marinisediminis]
METRYILAALSYFSIFFGGIIIPLVIWIVSNDPYVKRHSGRAFLSHILPYGLTFIVLMSFFYGQFMASAALTLLFMFVILVMVIWNVAMGVKVVIEAKR